MKRSQSSVRRPHRLRAVSAVFLIALTAWVGLVPLPADAQERPPLPPLQLQRFRLAPGPTDYLTLYGTSIPEHLNWHVSAFIDYADDPLQIATLDERFARTMEHQLHTSLMGSVAFVDVFEVGVLVPVLIAQRAGNLQPVLPVGTERTNDISPTALGDVRLSVKYQLLNLRDFPLGLAFITGLSLPTGNDDAFAGDGGVGAEAIVAADYILFKAVRLGTNLGYRYRAGNRQVRDTVVGGELLWGLGAHLPLLFENLDGLFELAGGLNIAPKGPDRSGRNERDVPVEFRGALRYRLPNDWTMTGGLGWGLTDGIGAPNYRAFFGLGGQWVTGGWFGVDYASPGFRGTLYPCEHGERNDPDLPLGADGCPLPPWERPQVANDRQVDRLLNVEPAPIQPRPPQPQPEPPRAEVPPMRQRPQSDRVQVTERQIVITEQVHFATGKADILPESYPILDDIVYVMESNPHIELLRIEGHTDSRGREAMNLDLSRRRAASVRQYLVNKGISANRLESEGYGPARPIADNATEEGRAKNRRVEFTIVRTR
jgi:OmpA-OmpF porin, OOP family